MHIYVGGAKTKCSGCGSTDWILVDPAALLRAMTELKCTNCQRVVLYAQLVIETPVETDKPRND